MVSAHPFCIKNKNFVFVFRKPQNQTSHRSNFSVIVQIAVRIHVMFDYMNHNISQKKSDVMIHVYTSHTKLAQVKTLFFHVSFHVMFMINIT